MPRWAWISASAVVLLVLTGCSQDQRKTGEVQVKIESQSQERPAVVSFAIAQDGKQLPDVWKYNASYTRHGRTARFGIEFLLARVSSAENQPRSGNGSFVADPKSYDADMLQDLKTALKSTVAAQSDIRVRRLPFTFVIEGENLDRGKNGDLIDAATGNWVKAKLFLGPQQDQEVFLNFQKPGGTGEFAVVDPTFGNAVLRELAKVL